MKTLCIVQARMGSSRLPGKVLKDIQGKTMLERVIGRVRQAKKITRLVIATTTNAEDQKIVGECEKLKAEHYRGSELDVLDRYYQAWRAFGDYETVIRITSDCPLIDPGIIDQVIGDFSRAGVDYACNVFEPHEIRGFDVEVMKGKALERAWREAKQPPERVHVTPFLYKSPGAFKTLQIPFNIGKEAFRLTVDTPEDLELVRAVYQAFDGRDDFSAREIIEFLRRKPELAGLNAHVRQKKPEEL